MDYRVDEVSLADPEIERQVEGLISSAFGIPIPQGRVRRNTAAGGRPSPLYVAAVQDGEIIGFNSFTAHRLQLNGAEMLAYQSGWTATSAAHRGKKIFQNLILAAQEILASRGASFVFGFPNSASHPIFIGKLGYRQLPSVKWQAPNLPLAMRLLTRDSTVDLGSLHRDTILQDDRALIALKRNEAFPAVETFEHQGSLCWGVRRERRLAGTTIGYLDVGGIELAGSRHLPVVVGGLLRQVRGTHVQLVNIAGAPDNKLLRGVRPSQGNVLIVRDLTFETTALRFNLYGGVRDVY